MYIFQPDRILLLKQIKKFSKYVNGVVLDAGAGGCSRYKKFFVFDKYIKMDIGHNDNIDITGSVESIPIDDNKIDTVICTQVFEHLKHPQTAAGEIFRVLKKGGYLLLTVPQTNELHEEPNDFFRYTCYGLILIFEEKGFKVMDCQQRGGLFSMTAQIKIRYLIDRFGLYKKPIIGKFFNQFIKIYAILMMWLDRIDKSKANKKHTLGWCVVFKK